MVDIGANLTNKSFDQDLANVLKISSESGVKSIVITGTNIRNSEKAIKICNEYNQYKLFSTVGIHPHNAKEVNDKSELEMCDLIEKNKCVKAIGECGLDFNRNFSSKQSQLYCFDMQIKLAIKYKLPLFLHDRDAHNDFLKVLDKYKEGLSNIKVVVHCFTGTKEEVKQYIERGFYIGITGWICDTRRNKDLVEAVKEIPLDRLMIETDSPFLSPTKQRRNTPENIFIVLEKLSELLSIDSKTLYEIILTNTVKFFKI